MVVLVRVIVSMNVFMVDSVSLVVLMVDLVRRVVCMVDLDRLFVFTKKPAFPSDMSGGAILRDFSKMAIPRDLRRVKWRAYTHFQAGIHDFLLI